MLHQPGLGGEMNDNDGGAPADLIDVANTVMAMVKIRHPLDRSLPPSWRRLLTRGADRGRSEASPRNDGARIVQHRSVRSGGKDWNSFRSKSYGSCSADAWSEGSESFQPFLPRAVTA